MSIRQVFSFIVLIVGAALFINKTSGQPKKYAGAPGDLTSTGCSDPGQGCHDNTVAGASITLTGAPANYVPGRVYPLTLTVARAGQLNSGFQIVATNGTDGNQVGTFSVATGIKLAVAGTGNGVGRLIHSTPKAGASAAWSFNWTAPSTGGPAAVKFYYSGVSGDNSGDEIGDQAPMGSTSLIPIGIELVAFNTSIQKDNHIKLDWQTATETDNKRFVIERKTDGMPFFQELSTVKGNGTTSQAQIYSFVDDTPELGKINYYRLRQEDFDGKITYSKVLSVALNTAFKLKVYPTVVKNGDVITIDAIGSSDKPVQIDVVNMNGQVVKMEKNTAYTEGVQFSVNNLMAGRYIVKVRNSQKQNYASFIVQ